MPYAENTRLERLKEGLERHAGFGLKRAGGEGDMASADWIRERWIFRAPFAQPIITCNYRDIRPDHRTPVEGLYLETMTQIYPEDRGQNYSIKMGDDVARMVVEDYAKRGAKPGAAA